MRNVACTAQMVSAPDQPGEPGAGAVLGNNSRKHCVREAGGIDGHDRRMRQEGKSDVRVGVGLVG
jgi:hypothetical protein